MSDTPRTDEREARSEGLHEGWGLTLARQLERELNLVTEERDMLLSALIWAMDKEPSPCRCIDSATPPHVCVGHRALNRSEEQP